MMFLNPDAYQNHLGAVRGQAKSGTWLIYNMEIMTLNSQGCDE